MITDEIQIRPRYGEVDQMGYVYHANYVSFCHQARTELLRKYNINDSFLEKNNIMLPVISFKIDYKNPSFYDELLTIKTTITDLPQVRLKFKFEIFNNEKVLVSKAESTVVFVDKETRIPMKTPEIVILSLQKPFSK